MKTPLRLTLLLLAAAAILAVGQTAAAQGNSDAQGPMSASPLAAYPGFGHHPQADDALFEREEAARERMIGQCMAAAGFEYRSAPSIDADDYPDLASALAAARTDPNELYVSSLDPAERERYFVALYGVPDPYSESAANLHDPASTLGGGCTAEAHRAIPGVYAAKNALRDELAILEQTVRTDSRVLAAEQRWSACMAERSHSYATPRDLHAEIDETLAQAEVFARPPAPEVAREHGSALADARVCDGQAGLRSAVVTARIEHEAAFVDAHRAVLDAHLKRLESEALPTR